MRMRLFLAILFFGCGACSEPAPSPEPRWVDLTRGFEPSLSEPALARTKHSRVVRWAEDPQDSGRNGGWITERFSKAAWTHRGAGIWRAQASWSIEYFGDRDLDARLSAPGADGKKHVVPTLEGDVFGAAFADRDTSPDAAEELMAEVLRVQKGEQGPWWFSHGRDLWLLQPEGGEPAEEMLLRAFISRGRPDALGWRVERGPLAGRGIVLLAGESQRMSVNYAPGSCLRFSSFAPPRAEGARLLLRLGEEVLLDQDLSEGSAGASQIVPLPDDLADSSVELLLQFVAPAGRVVLFDPIIGPAEVGSYGQRPWKRKFPDMVLVSADTFRADNLERLGGDPRWAPVMNELAEDSVSFLEAHSPSSWTLPAHTALFAGRMPRELSTHTRKGRLAEQVTTLAERYAEQGYRVEAITERGYLSRAYGMDQGFGRFEEALRRDQRTLAGWREALARDDGRPLFLLVHSYRAHGIYRVSEQTSQVLGVSGDSDALGLKIFNYGEPAPGEVPAPELQTMLDEYKALYRGASRDMDALFGELLTDLRSGGVLQDGFLCLFSDHGESFGEHGVVGHGASVWREETHVPLLLHGPGLEPRWVEQTASLIDLPRTLTAMAGIEPAAEWAGVDLLADPKPRPVASFQCGEGPIPNFVGIVEGTRKVVLSSQSISGKLGELRYAYDLKEDPKERRNLVGEADWVEDMDARLRPILRMLSKPAMQASAAKLDGAHAADLKAMGYAGEGEE